MDIKRSPVAQCEYMMVKINGKNSSKRVIDQRYLSLSVSDSQSNLSSPFFKVQKDKSMYSLEDLEDFKVEDPRCFEQLMLVKKDNYFKELQVKSSEISKAMLRQTKKVMFFWRGTNSMFPYSFKKCNLVSQEDDGNGTIDISIDLSKNKIEKTK